jgi:nucleotidyltransferase substrate binding protein (TIGR01987 family)
MEQLEKFNYKLITFEKAMKGFEVSLGISTLGFSHDVTDAIKNGRIQKFEFCTELTWKIVKNFLYSYHNIDAKSPRESIKEFFLLGAVNEPDYETLISILDDRNKLSHIYNEEYFDVIHDKLKYYHDVMKHVLIFLKENS